MSVCDVTRGGGEKEEREEDGREEERRREEGRRKERGKKGKGREEVRRGRNKGLRRMRILKSVSIDCHCCNACL